MQPQGILQKLSGYVPKVSFSVVLLAFFLPFLLVKCDDKEIARIKGIELVTGTSIDYEEPFSGENKQRTVEPNLYAIILFVIVSISLILSFIPVKERYFVKYLILFFTSFLGLIDFVLLYNSLQEEFALEFEVEFLMGFYLIPGALLLNFIFLIVAFATRAISVKSS